MTRRAVNPGSPRRSSAGGVLATMVACILAGPVLGGVARAVAEDDPQAKGLRLTGDALREVVETGGTEVPEPLEDVGVEEHLGDRVPVDLVFRDEQNREVTLADYLGQDRPVILAMVYYECPMLCGLVLNGVADLIDDLSLAPGADYQVVNVSINPKETYLLASMKKGNIVGEMDRTAAGSGWHFLTGEEENIRTLADAVGFKYAWNEAKQQYAHTAVLVLLTPEGEISRYVYGVRYKAKDVRLGLVEASEGRIGSSVDQLLLFCFQYSAKEGQYTWAAMNLMRLAGLMTVFLVGGLIGALFWRGSIAQPG